MEIKLEGRHVELGTELRDRVQKRFEGLDARFGPLTHARLSVEKKAHKNEQRAEATAVVNLAGVSITATKEAASVVAAVNETLDTLTENLNEYSEKSRKDHR